MIGNLSWLAEKAYLDFTLLAADAACPCFAMRFARSAHFGEGREKGNVGWGIATVRESEVCEVEGAGVFVTRLQRSTLIGRSDRIKTHRLVIRIASNRGDDRQLSAFTRSFESI